MTWGELLKLGERELKQAGIADWKTDAWYLFEDAFGMTRARYYLCAQDETSRAENPAYGGGPRQQEMSGSGRLTLYWENSAWNQESLTPYRESPAPYRESLTQYRKNFIQYRKNLARRSAREPLQYILGEQEFMGLPFYVNEAVLIPRQDTETLAEAVLADYKRPETAVLDLCTGSGCIAISLATLGGYQKVVAADISGEALRVARKNAERLLTDFDADCGVPNCSDGAARGGKPVCRGRAESTDKQEGGSGSRSARLSFRQGDLLSVCSPEEKFDVIVSNPPYIPSGVIGSLEPEVRDFEPRLALDGAADGLSFYRRLAEGCGRHLKENGRIYLEIGSDQGEAVCGLLAAHGFCERTVIKDLAGNDRVVRAVQKSGARQDVQGFFPLSGNN